MAIYHLSAKIISRGQGRSVMAAAAYRAAERLRDEHRGAWHDYTRKPDVGHRAILLPDGASPAWADRETLWNAVEAAERRRDAQLARELEIALPRELSKAEAIQLAEDFVHTECVARGMVADIAIHWGKTATGEAQPHAHILLTLRGVADGQFGPKRRDWNTPDLLRHWREAWASLANVRLAECGHDVRIDHRSYKALKLDLKPQVKLGGCVHRREAAGAETDHGTADNETLTINGAKIIATPGLALAAITVQQSVFTERDIARFLHGHTIDTKQFQSALTAVKASPLLVELGRDDRGETRYTTRKMLALERGLATTALTLAGRTGHGVAPQLCRRHAVATRLGFEQARALESITGGADLAAVVGHAGTGKSTLLGAARAVWERAGYRVRGAALSGIAAEGLQQGALIESRTIAAWLKQWQRGREMLSARDVLVVDEAGMVGSRDLAALLVAVRAAGAKLVLVGDPEQLQPIAAGAPFRAIAERIGAAALTTVRRQTVAWQRRATEELATGRTAEALKSYQVEGKVCGHASLDDAKAALITTWDNRRCRDPEASQILLAHRRADVRDLNRRARALRRKRGELGPDVELPVRDGVTTPFAAGERVYFLRNERSLGVRNGTLGTLLRIEGAGLGANLVVRLDDGREVAFSLKDYNDLDHGYAATVHKAQGVTVDHAFVLASPSMDRHLTYVALSRHRKRVCLYWSRDEFADDQRLRALLSRERHKESTLDYGDGAVVWDSSAAYAGRRGLIPESAILVPGAKPAAPLARPQPAPLALPKVSPAKSEPIVLRRRPPPPPWFRTVLPKLTSAISGAMPSWAGASAPSRATMVKTQKMARPMVKPQAAAKAPAAAAPSPALKPGPGASARPRPIQETRASPQPPPTPKPQAAPPWPAKTPTQVFASKPGQRKPKPEPRFGVMWRKLASVFSGVLPSRAKVSAPSKAAVAKTQQTAKPMVKPQPVAKAPAKPQAAPSSAPKPEPEVSAPSRPIQETRAAPQPRPERTPSPAAGPSQPVWPMAVPLAKPPGAQSSPPLEPAKPRPPVLAEATTPAASVAEVSSGHDAVPEESARAHETLAATRQGSLTEKKELGRAIARNPALRVPFREQNPELARQVERFSKLDRDRLIDQAPQQMPQPSPEPEPEPPTLGMGM